MAGRGEYEPKDSRNVTGTAATPDGRWTNTEATPPLANGEHAEPQAYEAEAEDEDDGEVVMFEPDPELERMIEQARARRRLEAGEDQTRH